MSTSEVTPSGGETRRRLRTRRGLLLSALPIVVLIAAAGVVLAVTHRNAAAEDRREEIQALADAAATNASRFVADQFTILQTIALAAPVRAADYDAMRPYLRRVGRNAAFSTSLFFVDRRARIQATRDADGVSLADRAYIRQALRGRPAVSDVLVARVSGQPTIVFARPVVGRDGTIVGALAGNLRLNEISDALKRLLYSPGAEEYLIDQADRLIIADAPVTGLQAPPRAVRLRQRQGTTVGAIDGTRRLVGYAPVPGTGWTAAVDLDYGTTLGPLNTAMVVEVVALGILAALGVFAVLLAGRRLERIERERDLALDEQRRIAAQLQRSMLPGLPSPPGVELEARYAPAQSELAVGGDWYDVVDVGGGRVAASLGDVAGHGLASAAVMGQLRAANRTLSLSGYGPGEALTALDRFTALVDGRPLATVAQLLLDTGTGRVRYACAGHPPPLLVRAAGGAEFLEDGRSPLLGIAPGEPREEGSARLEAGDALLAYTDGLVEHPDRSIDDGLAALRDLAAAIGPDPERLARELLAGVPEPRRDDVAILCVRLVGAPSGAPVGAGTDGSS